MPEALDVQCPCCQSQLKVDAETGAVVWVEEKKGPAHDLDELVDRVRTAQGTLDDKFTRSMNQARNQKQALERKFEEARRRAEADPNKKPINPFDLD